MAEVNGRSEDREPSYLVGEGGKRGVHQTRFGGPSDPPEKRGNCFAACLATILELPIDEFPVAAADGDGWGILLDWLWERGWYLTWKEHDHTAGWHPGYTIMGVESAVLVLEDGTPGGHSIVARDGEPWWNPNPSDGRNAEELMRAALGDVFFLYPLDPARPGTPPQELALEHPS